MSRVQDPGEDPLCPAVPYTPTGHIGRCVPSFFGIGQRPWLLRASPHPNGSVWFASLLYYCELRPSGRGDTKIGAFSVCCGTI